MWTGTPPHDPLRSLDADAGTHPIARLAAAYAGGRSGAARLCGEAWRGRGRLGRGRLAARLRLRALSQRGALAHGRAPQLGRAAAAGAGAAGGVVPGDP